MSRAREVEALAAARSLVARLAEEGRHHVAAALLTETGMHTGINLECTLPRGSICAEPVALGALRAAEGDTPVLFSIAVNRRGEVIPPCAFCRELLVDFGPEARIAVSEEGGVIETVALRDLLPHAYKAHLRLEGA